MGDVKIPNWLKGLPFAPEFRPTDTEFADPIAYISKIEKEASVFGICKVIPPLPKPSKKYVISNLNKSLSKSPELGPDINVADVSSSSKMDSGNEANDGEVRAVFTTRHQELGQNAKKTKGAVQAQPPVVHKQVWQSGEVYTLEQFESKSKAFARSQLGMVKEHSPLVIEALFWTAATEKPIYVEYANDVPGSGFGEPEGTLRYFHRRRRRRLFSRNSRVSSYSKKYHVNTMSNNCENTGASTKNSPNSLSETSKVSVSLPIMLSNQTSQISKQKISNASNEMEGTSGWKLSNSPWNLQVIARSPGSLTRFMPDDIPGVTSPMVYIGMLFSWFAWHVEDHELHSLNFLHTGSPKTWYAVPGDYAFAFEEVVRNQAYAGNYDRLAALSLLGEKTTLLSPEVVVESGIPCCRLVQNPGEFVVTFPRAYHVGFSHGFNCGEAANFGTSKWLKVAKEAAVRRAAMNYLPMLSHQQLLYLLTMSFISRIPRSLLPGARSSRLRDRQREERELSVKKAFIEDILGENNLLTSLLGKNSSYHVVLWDLESLPSPSKQSEPCSSVATFVPPPSEDVCSEIKEKQDLLSEMSLYMETVNDLYLDDDDLSCDFQVDSGTLACVACGILGFPFMSVVQPSEKVSMELLHDLGVSKHVEAHSPLVLDDMVDIFVSDGLKDEGKTLQRQKSSEYNCHIPTSRASKCESELKLTKDDEKSSADANSFPSDAIEKIERNERNLLHNPNSASSSAKSIESVIRFSEDLSAVPDLSPPLEDLPVSSEAKFDKGWSATRGFLRPRIFCLEHAIQIEELLRSKGGANVLVICHSDFQKIKAHAAAIAEEIGSPFGYNEIPLDNASQEDLNLIDLAIDDEEHDECGKDWTSKLSINLRYCVKVRKNSPSKQEQHALVLDGLFSNTTPSSNTFNIKWPSRKSRSKRNLNLKKPSESIQLRNPVQMKLSGSIQIEKDDVLGAKSDGGTVRKEGKLNQYSRRNFKSKPGGSATATKTFGHSSKYVQNEVSVADCGNLDKHSKNVCQNILFHTENTGKNSSGLTVLGSNENPGLTIRDLSENSVPSQVADLSLAAASPGVENVEAQIDDNCGKEMIMKGKACDLTSGGGLEMQHEIEVDEGNKETDKLYAEKSGGSLSSIAVESTENCETQRENQITEEISLTKVACDLAIISDEQCNIQSNGGVLTKEASDLVNSVPSCANGPVVGSSDAQREQNMADNIHASAEAIDSVIQEKIESVNRSKEKEPVLSNVEPLSRSVEEMHSDNENCSVPEKRVLENADSTMVCPKSTARNGRKRRREVEADLSCFIRGPCEGLRPRAAKDVKRGEIDDSNKMFEEKPTLKKTRKSSDGVVSLKDKKEKNGKGSHRCDLEGCRMSFETKADLLLHKRNRCPHEGCGKRFSSHKYAMLHQRVHDDDRPLKCPWKGCTMSFKWAWARTEHLRVHTGERPYQCKVEGCGLTFRFVSDYSRHRRKTGHYVNLPT